MTIFFFILRWAWPAFAAAAALQPAAAFSAASETAQAQPPAEVLNFSGEAPVPEAVRRAARSVYHITNNIGFGTGFAAGRRLILTNFHVIWTLLGKGGLDGISLKPNHLSGSGAGGGPWPKNLKIRQMLRLSAALDLALLEVSHDMPFYLTLRQSPPSAAENLFIIGYPQNSFAYIKKAGPAQSFSGLMAFPVNYFDLRGASGGPVLDARGRAAGALFGSDSYHALSAGLSQLKRFVEGREGEACQPAGPVWECFFQALKAAHEKAERGDALSLYRLGAIHAEGFWMKSDPARAADLYRGAAESGFVLAQKALGGLHILGKGVEKSESEALYWHRRAALQGHRPAQSNLGAMRYNGEGAEKSIQAALKWYRQAARQGCPMAQNNLASMLYKGEGSERNFEKAAFWSRLSAERGHRGAQARLGYMFYRGEGVPQSSAGAFLWLQKAAEQGHAEAQQSLGFMYYRGEGVEKNFEKALYWHSLAADQGSALSLFTLGAMHYNGEGTERNLKKAKEFFLQAADLGLPEAAAILKKLPK